MKTVKEFITFTRDVIVWSLSGGLNNTYLLVRKPFSFPSLSEFNL
ncbi:MAG: hypothetical protein P8Z35_11720 [Ignavibacteriaceae bacterium]